MTSVSAAAAASALTCLSRYAELMTHTNRRVAKSSQLQKHKDFTDYEKFVLFFGIAFLKITICD